MFPELAKFHEEHGDEEEEATVEPCAPKGRDLTGTGLTTPDLLPAVHHLLWRDVPQNHN